MSEGSYELSIDQIREFLPHRYPFLMIDRILSISPVGDLSNSSSADKVGVEVIARKCISASDMVFEGHFPGYSIYPGVLLIEAMAQTSSFSIYPYVQDQFTEFVENFLCIFVGIDQARFRKPVVPGDLLEIRTEVLKTRGELWVFRGEIKVEGQRVADAEFRANLSLSGKSKGLK
ncbi:MAG: 3-hydroxyacyl-[acyl-carrier-protein] dehydratase FabZ [Bdellovibrionaceae bacterium]|nr:3-hydroxyacyl-[acyl-carrier-protein] dehydratase FabZ [Pseudobdellovibrionaceae bacterium]|tara:strand:- start:2579 stop:3103 length:525 start_codon:yes stop_codon:yes gene_type:complete